VVLLLDIVKKFDSYIKRTIINSVKDFKEYETRKMNDELSLNYISEQLNNEETAILSFTDNYAVFSLHLEDIVEDEKLYNIIRKLTEQEKEILTLSILEEWTSKEIGSKFAKSDSRIRHIIKDTIDKIRKEYKEKG